ncbi:MAG TPA: class I SAM-dependent methyltransferase [Phototrophicaceae bacterium]|nr:class I SAM-dependent methyltransferase [Phototrophicaceae bacterium]
MPGFYATVARYYDAEHQDKTDDLELYSDLAAEYGSPIFEVACGTGRVMLRLAQEGYEIHGIDIEPAMLDFAQSKVEVLPDDLKKNLKLILGNVLQYETDQRYNLILVPYNGLLHFHNQDDLLRLLRKLRGWLTADGLLVLDQANPADAFGSQDTDAMILEKTFLEPETGHLVMQYSVSSLDRTAQMLQVNWIYDEVTADGTIKRTLAPVLFRYVFYSELRLLLQLAGFEVEAVYGSLDFEPYEDGCERMLVLAKPK